MVDPTHGPPVNHDNAHPNQSTMSDREMDLLQQRDDARRTASEALDALVILARGVRIIARQMRHSGHVAVSEEGSSASDDQSCSSLSSTQSVEEVAELSAKLQGDVASDLMGLCHAATMVGEHARLAAKEASILTEDIQQAQQITKVALKRAHAAETSLDTFKKENRTLQQQVKTLRSERRVLKREVKHLRQELAISMKQEMLRALEYHVAGALQVHERQLALRSKASSECTPSEEQQGQHEESCGNDHKESTFESQSGDRAVPKVDGATVSPTDVSTSAAKSGFGATGFAVLGMSWSNPKPLEQPHEKEPTQDSPQNYIAQEPTPEPYVPVKLSSSKPTAPAMGSIASKQDDGLSSMVNRFFSRNSSANNSQQSRSEPPSRRPSIPLADFECCEESYQDESRSPSNGKDSGGGSDRSISSSVPDVQTALGHHEDCSMPTELSFEAKKEQVQSPLATPIVTPTRSPAGCYKTLRPLSFPTACDPNILRSLAIPDDNE